MLIISGFLIMIVLAFLIAFLNDSLNKRAENKLIDS